MLSRCTLTHNLLLPANIARIFAYTILRYNTDAHHQGGYTMIEQDLVERVTQLSVPARRELIALIERSLQDQSATPTQAQRAAALDRLFGALQIKGPPPTDKELQEDYVDYLSRKYE